jgi:hypothetical protein
LLQTARAPLALLLLLLLLARPTAHRLAAVQSATIARSCRPRSRRSSRLLLQLHPLDLKACSAMMHQSSRSSPISALLRQQQQAQVQDLLRLLLLRLLLLGPVPLV